MSATAPARTVIEPRVEHDPGRAFRLWDALLGAHAALVDRLDGEPDACQVVGLDVLGVLVPLLRAPGHRLRMHELAERSHLSPSGLTRRVDRLEREGLVRRGSCSDDRRAAHAILTPRGEEVVRRALPFHARVLEAQLRTRLTDGEIEQLTCLLDRLARQGAADAR